MRRMRCTCSCVSSGAVTVDQAMRAPELIRWEITSGSRPSCVRPPGLPSRSLMLEVQGHNGTVSVDGHFITIQRKNFLARATIGKGDKRIPIGSLTAVQWKPAGPIINGFIEFTVGGGTEARSKFGSASMQAGQNENAVMFKKAQMPAFEQLRVTLEHAIVSRDSGSGPAPAPPNIGEQIGQLAALRDQSILTEQEFQMKKEELLRRM